jgi:hypothetical protein
LGLGTISVQNSGAVSITGGTISAGVTIASLPVASTTTPAMDTGAGVVGTGTNYARNDHAHPTDTSRVTKAGDSMTGALYVNYGLYLQGAFGSQSANASFAAGGTPGWSYGCFAWAGTGLGGAFYGRSDSVSANLAYWAAGSNAVGNIATNGSTTSYNTSSDLRKKRNIRALTQDVDIGALIDAIQPVAFEWIKPADLPEEFQAVDPTDHGFVAQHLVTIAPRAVTRGDDEPELRPAATRTDEPSGGRAWGIDASKLMPYVIAELQALRRRVAELEAQLP